MNLKCVRLVDIRMAFIPCLKKRGMLPDGFLSVLPVMMFLISAKPCEIKKGGIDLRHSAAIKQWRTLKHFV